MRCIPNMVIMTPADAEDCRGLLTTAFLHDGPSAVRYPRGASHGSIDADHEVKELRALPFGQAEKVRDGNKIALLVFGTLLTTALEVAEEIDATVYNMRFVKPLDTEAITEASELHELLVSIEDNAIAGGAGSAIVEFLNQNNLNSDLLQLGFPDEFINHGSPEELLKDWKLDKNGILGSIQNRIKENITR
jgi:1-deoxy-D-xylulose-5-phosphate synthase